MDDWRLWLTREEHEHASIEQLKKSLAASRALVEKKEAALTDVSQYLTGRGHRIARQALALTEETA